MSRHEHQNDRQQLIADVQQTMRRTSALGVLFSHAVAERLDMRQADLETLDILQLSGPVTAGRLAELTGLSTGAITGLVDRLATAGYVRRERDDSDRRKVIIHLQPDAIVRDIAPLFAPMGKRMWQLMDEYTDDELRTIRDHADKAGAILQEEAARLREIKSDE